MALDSLCLQPQEDLVVGGGHVAQAPVTGQLLTRGRSQMPAQDFDQLDNCMVFLKVEKCVDSHRPL